MTDILATEATLEELKDRIGDEVAPDAGTVNKQLADILIDSLLNLKTSDLQITASKELVILNTSLVGAVETPNIAFAGGIPKVALGYGSLADLSATGALASDATWSTLLDLAGNGIFEALNYSCNYGLTEVQVTLDGQYLYLPDADGDWVGYASPNSLNAIGGKSSWWEEMNYDTVDNNYALRLTRSLQYNTSLRIQYRQQSGSAKKCAIHCWYRSIA